MEYILNSYEPQKLFHYFEDISRIPRGSGNESGIADYLCEFARAHSLRYFRDSVNNVAIFKDATNGMEKAEPVMLQGHTDIVCEKNASTVHDFMTEPLKLVEKDGWLSADGTTLGADDGVAVALMLDILSSDDVAHPALECLFTVQEETGLGGAELFDYSHLTARKIINLDTEEEGIAVASCAGSMNVCFTLESECVRFENKALRINILGLGGGHSGTEINSGAMNANILMGRLLAELYDKQEFNLVSLSGGNKRNAIPRECEAVISTLDREKATEILLKAAEKISREVNEKDSGFKVHINSVGKKEKMLTFKDTSKIISLLSLVPNGVISMSQSKKELVESSSNLGVIAQSDNIFSFFAYARSSVEAMTDNILIRMSRLAKLLGMKFEVLDRCPGWAFVYDTELQKLYKECYSELFGIEPKVEAIHAGLECGIILEKMGGGDAIAIGPQMHDIHTPDERLDLHSLERARKLLVSMLARLK